MSSRPAAVEAAELRRGIATIADQLSRTLDGQFDFQVTTDVGDEAVQRLAMLTNRLLGNLRQSNGALDAADRAKRQVLADVSHDLRTPLNAVIGYSEIMLEDFEAAGDTAHAEDTRKILQSSTHLLGLLGALLELPTLEAGKAAA